MDYLTKNTVTFEYYLLYWVIAILLLTSCSLVSDDDIENDVEKISVTPVDYARIELEVLEIINDYRVSINLEPLEKMDVISIVAETHSNHMVETGIISHDEFHERSALLIGNAHAKSVAENVAYGYATAQGAVNAWLNSDGHKKVIENSKYTHFGISIKQCEKSRNYFTNIFILKD